MSYNFDIYILYNQISINNFKKYCLIKKKNMCTYILFIYVIYELRDIISNRYKYISYIVQFNTITIRIEFV